MLSGPNILCLIFPDKYEALIDTFVVLSDNILLRPQFVKHFQYKLIDTASV